MARNIIKLDDRFTVNGRANSRSNVYQANVIPVPALIPGGSAGQHLAKLTNLSYDVVWVDAATAYTFSNALTEINGAVVWGGDLTQTTTIINGHATLPRGIIFGGSNFISSFGINAREDIDIFTNNIAIRGTGTSTLGHTTEGTVLGVVPISSSPSGIRIRSTEVQATNAKVGQVFTLKNAGSGEGEWEDSKYVQTFLSSEFITQTLTITAATHVRGINPAINVYSGTTTRTAIYPGAVSLVSITVAVNGDVTLTSTLGNEFNGQIIIT